MGVTSATPATTPATVRAASTGTATVTVTEQVQEHTSDAGDPLSAVASSLTVVDVESPGWTRRRAGRGFRYVGVEGQALAVADVARCRALVIPPAWREVWICPDPVGHIQAVGMDEAGRRQYLYHQTWRVERDRAKFARVAEVAARLPAAREVVAGHLALAGMPRERALATAFRLLDLGFFRIGSEGYVESGHSYGLATVEKQHVKLDDGSVVFDYTAKHGKQRVLRLRDADVFSSIGMMRRRRGGDDDLLAWRDRRGWHDLSSTDINTYVKEVVGGDVSAKDFRTWHATVLAAVALAVSTNATASDSARRRAISRAMREVSEYLGNTPAVARASYVDPRVVEAFDAGLTIEDDLLALGDGAGFGHSATHGGIEQAVLRLLELVGTSPSLAGATSTSVVTGSGLGEAGRGTGRKVSPRSAA